VAAAQGAARLAPAKIGACSGFFAGGKKGEFFSGLAKLSGDCATGVGPKRIAPQALRSGRQPEKFIHIRQ
jgi:hypothetical protein